VRLKVGLGPRAEANARRLDDRQPARQKLQPAACAGERLQGPHDLPCIGMVGKVEHHDARIVCGRIVPNIREVEISCDERLLFKPCVLRDDIVRGAAHADVTDIDSLVSQITQECRGRTWEAGVHQEAHACSSGGQRVVLFLVQELARESQGGLDILDRQIVLALNVLEAHATGEAPHDEGHRRTGPPNHGLPVADFRVDDDTIFHRKKKRTRSPHAAQGWAQSMPWQAAS